MPHSAMQQPVKSQDRLLNQSLFPSTQLHSWLCVDDNKIRSESNRVTTLQKINQSRGWKRKEKRVRRHRKNVTGCLCQSH